MAIATPEVKTDETKPTKVDSKRPIARYTEPQPICDATSDFEQMDRGEGWGIDDEPTYHRTEK